MVSPTPELTESLVGEMIQSNNPFPVLFAYAAKWLGYSRRDNAKRALTENFVSGLDYDISQAESSRSGGRPSEIIRLTVDCFKALGMMAGTEKGREVRRYFLECERQLKEVRQAQLDSNCALVPKKEGFCGMRQAPDGNATLQELSRRYEFGRGRPAQVECRDWIRTLGIGDNEWVQYSSPNDIRLPRKFLAQLDAAMAHAKANPPKPNPWTKTNLSGATHLYLVAAAAQLLKDAGDLPESDTLLHASVDIWQSIADQACACLGYKLTEG